MCLYPHGSFNLWFILEAVSYFSRKSEVLKWSVGRSHVQYWTRVLCYGNYFFIFLLSSDKCMGFLCYTVHVVESLNYYTN